jgi:tripartite-type tricarboxylate transporter receptor subunit TctC
MRDEPDLDPAPLAAAPPRRREALAAAAGLALAAFAPRAFAQEWPTRPVKLLVGYSAGGGMDAMARLLAGRLTERLGQQVVVENRAGASGVIAAEAVARSPADGYTLMLADSSLLISRALNPKLPVDPIASFAPVAGLFQLPLLLVANRDVPAATPAELVALLKAAPGRYSYATSGVGTVHHLGFEVLKSRTGTFVVHIPYRGAAQILPDVIGGQVPLAVVSATAGMAQAQAGKVKAIGLFSTGRLPGLEAVPPLADAVPGLDVAPRVFAIAPAGLAAGASARLAEAVRLIAAEAEVAQRAAGQGATLKFAPAAALAGELRDELATWTAVVQAQRLVGT